MGKVTDKTVERANAEVGYREAEQEVKNLKEALARVGSDKLARAKVNAKLTEARKRKQDNGRIWRATAGRKRKSKGGSVQATLRDLGIVK